MGCVSHLLTRVLICVVTLDVISYLKGRIYGGRDLPPCAQSPHACRPPGFRTSQLSREPGASSSSSTWVQGPGTWAIYHCFPRCTSWKGGLKSKVLALAFMSIFDASAANGN